MTRIRPALGITLLALAAPARAQIATRVARLPDGEIHISFAARAGICGDGRSFIGDASEPGGLQIYMYSGEGYMTGLSTDFSNQCLPGPVRVSLTKADGRVTNIRVYAGGPWREPGEELGAVSAPEAAVYLLDVAQTAPERAASAAMLAATLADSARIGARLVALARDRNLRPLVRERALRWLEPVAQRESGVDAERVMRELAADGTDIASVRERAIRNLPPSQVNDGFLRDLYPRLTVPTLKDRVIRRLGEGGGAENASWMQAVILNQAESQDLRDRALRVLAEDLGYRDRVLQLYSRVPETNLRERIIRLAGDQGDDASIRWLKAIVENTNERAALRDRALRMLGERGETAYIMNAYRTLGDSELKDRAVRLLAESGSTEARQWLRGIVLDANEPESLRDRALRALAEGGLTSTADLRDMYRRLTEPGLRERALRIAGERGDEASIAWLKTIVESGSEPLSLRDRSVRTLAERGQLAYLRTAYARITEASLRERVVRLAAEAGGTDNLDWLRAIARNAAEDAALRDRAVRSLAEAGAPTDELAKLYDVTDSRSIQERLIRIMAERSDSTAIQKLIAIARNDRDDSLRRFALRRLAAVKR